MDILDDMGVSKLSAKVSPAPSSWTAPTHTLRLCTFRKGMIQISHATALEDRRVALITLRSQALFESARQGRKC